MTPRKKQIIVSVMAIIIIFVGLGVSFHYTYNYTSNKSEVYVKIDQGLRLKDISNILKDKGIIRSSIYFTVYTKLKGVDHKIQYGNYIIPPIIELNELLEKLQKPENDYVIVTIPEGYTLYQIAERLEENNLADVSKLMSLQLEELSPNHLVSSKNTYYSLEGYLFPDTYYIPIDFNEKQIAKMMFDRFQYVFTKQYYNRAKELGLSLDEVMVIASLIEKEAANDRERKTISGVIYNRLKIDMLLQIDPSVIYGITKGEKKISRVTYNDLKSKSPYNTYLNKGLPPGPIASPGKASIEAALYPEEHDYLYYVMGEGGHVFSKTYGEHLKNVQRYIK